MTVREFLKALEDIKRTHGYNRFDLYLKYDDKYTQVWLGRYDPFANPGEDGEGQPCIIPLSRNLVEFYTTNMDGDLEEKYDTVEKFKKALKQFKVADNAVIQLTTNNMTAEELYIDYSHSNEFDILKVVPAKRKNTIVLVIDDFGTAPQLKTYDIRYTIWEQNKYSTTIDAYSKEEAEAKFNEMYNDPKSGKYDERDAEIVDIRES